MRNIEYLFQATHNLSLDSRHTVEVLLVGYLADAVSEETWKRGIESAMALEARTRPEPEEESDGPDAYDNLVESEMEREARG
jgi:hypothetical protein